MILVYNKPFLNVLFLFCYRRYSAFKNKLKSPFLLFSERFCAVLVDYISETMRTDRFVVINLHLAGRHMVIEIFYFFVGVMIICMFQEICHLICLIYEHRVVKNSALLYFNVCRISRDVLSIPNTGSLCFFLFFLTYISMVLPKSLIFSYN